MSRCQRPSTALGTNGVRRAVALLFAFALLALATPAQAEKRIALSFDDVPRFPGALMTPAERTVALIAALSRAGVTQAAFFVNPANLDRPWGPGGADRIAAYVAAGHVIANHSWDHPHLTGMAAADYLANIDRATAWLEHLPGYRAWFRFPFLDEGADAAQRDAVRAGLAQRHLANGYVTVDGSDWHIEQLMIDAARADKPIDRAALCALYVEDLVGAADHADALARAVLHRQPIQVALMHETDLEAACLETVVAALRADGWEIATIDAAFADPLPDPPGPWIGGNRLEALAAARGRPSDEIDYPPAHPDALTAAFNARVLHETPGHPDESQDP